MVHLKTRTIIKGVAIASCATFLSQGAMAATTLSMSTCLPRNHDQVEAFFDTFVDEMKSDQSAVKLDYKGGPEITPRKRQANALKRGLLDVILCPTYYVGLVPEARALTPSTASPMRLRDNGGYEMLQKAWAKGMNARILGWGNHGGAQFHFYLGFEPKLSKKTGLDLKGIPIRATAIYQPFLVKMNFFFIYMGC